MIVAIDTVAVGCRTFMRASSAVVEQRTYGGRHTGDATAFNGTIGLPDIDTVTDTLAGAETILSRVGGLAGRVYSA